MTFSKIYAEESNVIIIILEMQLKIVSCFRILFLLGAFSIKTLKSFSCELFSHWVDSDDGGR